MFDLKRRLVLISPMLLGSCSPAALLNALAPRDGVAAQTAVAYAPGLALDVYAPAPPCPGAPAVVFFYGGGWQSGSRGMYAFVGAALAQAGVVTVIPDYLLAMR